MNALLCKPFYTIEVKEAIFHMGRYKTPGLDGYGAGFYQHHWSIVGPKITTYVLSFLIGSASIKEINYTYLALIPKKVGTKCE